MSVEDYTLVHETMHIIAEFVNPKYKDVQPNYSDAKITIKLLIKVIEKAQADYKVRK
jgi:hypothetical protein